MTRKKTIVVYKNKKGSEPFTEWLNGLKDRSIRARISNRISRLELGNFGDYESVGDGVFELRLFFGPGFRVYLSEYDKMTLILLCGGNKKTQGRDILKAKKYWQNCKELKSETF